MTKDLTLRELIDTNVARSNHWHQDSVSGWSLSDWGVAAAGEMGEALNVIKKLNRNRDGLVGNVKDEEGLISDLGEELADVVIYLILLADRVGIDLEAAIVSKFNKVSDKHGFNQKL